MVRPAPFEITERTRGVVTTLSVAGELDLGSAPLLGQRVEDKLSEHPTTLTLDLSGLTFMDSSGLRLLIELTERARRETWKLTLIPSRHEAAKTVLQVTGADVALPFEDK
jgi:anti-sigma B factor antagonist